MALRGTAGITGTNSGGSAPVTLNVAGIGIQNGDIVLICVNCSQFTSSSTPSGFTQILAETLNGSLNNFALYWKVAASEPSSYSIDTGSHNMAGAAQCRVYSGRSGSITASQATADSFAAFSITANATGLTASAGDDVVAFYSFNSGAINNFGWTPPSGYANGLITQDTVNTQVSPLWSADNVGVAGGATGTVTATLTNSGGDTSGHHAAFLISLAQQPAGGSASIAWIT